MPELQQIGSEYPVLTPASPIPQNLGAAAALLVASCDPYADLWPCFFRLLRTNWPDCPFRVYLLCDTRVPKLPGINVIAVGPHHQWSGSIRTALELIPEEYVLLLLDDLFIVKPVNTARILQLVAWLRQVGGSYLRISGFPGPDRPYGNGLGELRRGTCYRTATVGTIWRKSTLHELLVPSESAWQFEVNGSIRSDAFDGFYATQSCEIALLNGVIKGRWRRSSVRALTRIGLDPGTAGRGLLSIPQEVLLFYKIILNRALYVLPSRWRRSIRNLLVGKKYEGGAVT